ncbi:ATP-binding protein [Gaoshiqia sediminis]|uniref:ATP-binding protein n=1 Tax=Gaoshiqia sediminis TaxID=2986998 RepID=A0AA42CA63_9BACT|nr:ATP-binding protein [Gaoshiqia sediminis]MCW0483080.1 ATP-binding protein [Gaoshiqia sediminis]
MTKYSIFDCLSLINTMKLYITREIYKKRIDRYIGKELIKVLIGQRRVGKSYLLFQAMDSIRERFQNPNIIYINLELNEYEKLNTSTALYDYVKSKSIDGGLNFLMIDEIQVVPEFEKALRSLLAEGGFDIYCTGSNANILSGELGTFLGGRYVEIPVHTLNYPEFLVFHRLENTVDSLNQYLKYGGLPYLIHLDLTDETVFDYLKNISQSILFRDVVSRFEVRNVDFLNRLIRYLANETGNLISARGISKFLKSQNVSISINAILNYLNYLTTAMLIAGVQRSDIQGKKVFEVGEKYYFNDIGLRNSIAGFSPFDLGQIIENAVYLHLRTIGYDVLVGKQQEKEIDFIAERKGEKVYIQVALRITEKQTMDREFGNLLAIKDNYPKYVVTLDEYSGSSFEGIKHIPLRQFLTEFV